MTIKFWRVKGEQYGCFSNFSYHGFNLDGFNWSTSEHYYQAQKFSNSDQMVETKNGSIYVFDYIWNQKGPMGAAKEGRRRDFIIDPNWEVRQFDNLTGENIGAEKIYALKDLVMYRALQAKFGQNESIKKILLSTNEQKIIEDSPTDYYWGCGKSGLGKNMLGELLMILRHEFRAFNG